MLRDKCLYLTLFQNLTAHMQGLKVYVQGYASNQEKSLRVACVQEFPTAVLYICVVHAKRNILEKCSELVSKTLSSEIIEDIFGQSAYISLSLPGTNIG